MLKFSCSKSRLVNWILHQVGHQPEAIFPRRKGWEFYFKIFHPGDKQTPFFWITVSNQRECVFFVPLDETVRKSHFKQMNKKYFMKEVQHLFEHTATHHQLIFMTSEKNLEYVTHLMRENQLRDPLLALDSEKMDFIQGNFDNPRLEHRFACLKLDSDMIPDFLPANLPMINEGLTKSGFYLNLFHYLNQQWLFGVNQVLLREIIKASIPYWKYYNKAEQNQIIQQVTDDLNLVFEQIFSNEFKIEDRCKKSGSLPKTMILLPDTPKTKRSMSQWQRKQSQALRLLKENVEQISIDMVNLSA